MAVQNSKRGLSRLIYNEVVTQDNQIDDLLKLYQLLLFKVSRPQPFCMNKVQYDEHVRHPKADVIIWQNDFILLPYSRYSIMLLAFSLWNFCL